MIVLHHPMVLFGEAQMTLHTNRRVSDVCIRSSNALHLAQSQELPANPISGVCSSGQSKNTVIGAT